MTLIRTTPARTKPSRRLRQKGAFAAASKEYRRVEELNKRRTNVQAATLATNIGVRRLGQGDVEGAIEKFREALKVFPDFATAYYQLGIALRKQGDFPEAAEAFEKARILDPRLKPPRS